MSAPYANQLTAAPTGPLFAWVEDTEGRHNLYVGSKDIPARSLTHNTEDDGQDIRQLTWSPDTKFIAYTYGAESGADGKPANPAHLQRTTPLTVIVQPTDATAKPIVIGEGRLPLFSRDGRRLFYVRDGQIWIAGLGAGAETPHQLVYDRGSVGSLTLSPDGKTLAFISRRHEANEPSHTLLALYSLTTHTLSFPAPSTGDDSAPAFSPDGKYLAWLRVPFTAADTAEFALNRVSANPWSIQLLDIAAGTTRTAYSPEPNKPGSVLPIPDDEVPYLLWDAKDEIVFYSEADGWDHLYLLDPSSGLATLLTPGNVEVEGAALNAHDNVLVWSSNDPLPEATDADRRHIWQLNLAHTGEAPKEHETHSSDTHPILSADGNTLAVLASDTHTPAHVEILVTNSGAERTSLNRLPSSYPAASLVAPQQVLFPSTDNLQIHGQLFLPAHLDPTKKHATLIFMHGGPRRQMLLGYPAMEYYSNAYAMNQYLASRGFIVLSVNYRCGIGYGLDFRQCGHEGATGAAEYNDILAAAKYLQSRPDVDPKRIGLWGGSYGGYLTALGLARNSDIFAAGVDFHGVHDWNLEDNAGDWKRGDNAEQDAIAKEALASSPLGDISHWHSPILLIHGDNDPSVAYAQTPRLADALRARNATLPKGQQVDVEELIFPDEVHEFLLHKDWLAAYTATAAFFERTLQPNR
ncbi:prolyl oligopeptidase family serine peptidase [Granulicella sp. 5B5]|uniref:S9 family peptidase n=1 Tax=Granulicella sp. 5B5 TaxID=1617967 RepID=UPI0015F3F26C|nr:prolyl oligopeptidase family serine peptidase [Granulicella sp. 5B5]